MQRDQSKKHYLILPRQMALVNAPEGGNMITIRSQNMELLTQTNYVEYDHEYNISDVINGVPREEHTIQAGYGTVGKYATRERCLEIIDEIQKRSIEKRQPLSSGRYVDITPFYQMPAE
jgi:hypothetical protein